MMEKILNSEFRCALEVLLAEAGVSKEDSSKLINSKYKAALKEAAISRLKEVIHLIIEDRYNVLDMLIKENPSGDGYGSDNCYISFKDIADLEDIGNIIFTLRYL